MNGNESRPWRHQPLNYLGGWRGIGPPLMAASAIVFGGTSQLPSPGDLALRIIASLVLAYLWFDRGAKAISDGRRVDLAFWIALFAVPCIQLIPLPPALWLHGTTGQLYRDGYHAMDIPVPWHALSLRPDRTRDALFFLLPPFASFLIGRSTTDRQLTSAAIAWIVAAAIAGLIGAVQAFNHGEPQFYAFTSLQGAEGFFSNRNHMALFMALSILPTVWLASRERYIFRVYTWPITLATVGFFLWIALLTQSRAGLALALLAIVIAAMAFVAPLIRGSNDSRRLAWWFGGAALLMVLVGVVGGQGTFLRFAEFADGNPRLAIVPQLMMAMRENLPFGSGLGSFFVVFPQHETLADIVATHWNMAHNDWIQIFIEAGILAVAPVLLFIAAALNSAVAARTLLASDTDVGRESASLIILAFGIVALTLMHSLVDYPIRTPTIAIFVAFWYGVAARASRLSDGRL